MKTKQKFETLNYAETYRKVCLFRNRMREGFYFDGVFMKTLALALLLFIFGCKENPVEAPITPTEIFDCSGAWSSNTKTNPNWINLFILQKNEHEFTADVFQGFNFLGTIENGKIINGEKFVSFSFESQTPFGTTSMGFNGRFYQVENKWELRGLLSGRVYLGANTVWIFDSEQYKFNKADFAYMFKR